MNGSIMYFVRYTHNIWSYTHNIASLHQSIIIIRTLHMHIADRRWDHGKFDQSEVNNAQTVTAVFFT